LRSFVEPASLFIDIMMNVGVIFYAGLKTGDERLLDIAHKHCLTTRRRLVRGDGSTSHEAIFDLETGECLRQSTHQGYRGDSCREPGPGWAAYRFHGLEFAAGKGRESGTANAKRRFFLGDPAAHILDGVTPWDYDAPESGPLARTQVD